jgi:hypothetical protein
MLELEAQAVEAHTEHRLSHPLLERQVKATLAVDSVEALLVLVVVVDQMQLVTTLPATVVEVEATVLPHQ